MKKLFPAVLFIFFIPACATIDNLQQAVKCKYSLAGVETVDSSFTNLTLNVAMAVTNQSKTAAAKMNRFEGKLYLNDNEVGNISFNSYEVQPSSTSIVKTQINIPFDKIGKNIAGLVIANSISINYKIVGTIYFDTPLGQLPFPITVQQQPAE
ncbi:MAG: hypothetical protein LBG46_03170 [Elusimicrobiota bacterium]|jgi:hypothetical protein|nr:hypothetical protein [Elusimicrobiota bacterium]